MLAAGNSGLSLGGVIILSESPRGKFLFELWCSSDFLSELVGSNGLGHAIRLAVWNNPI